MITHSGTDWHRDLAEFFADAVLHNAPQVDAVVRPLWDRLTTQLMTRCRRHGNRC